MKILVNKLPKKCADCLFIRLDNVGCYCLVLNELIDDKETTISDCPLAEHIHYGDIKFNY